MKAKLLAGLILSSCWLHSAERPWEEWSLELGSDTEIDMLPSGVEELADRSWLVAWQVLSTGSVWTKLARISPDGIVLWERLAPDLATPSPLWSDHAARRYVLSPNGAGTTIAAVSFLQDGTMRQEAIDLRVRTSFAFPTPGGGGFVFDRDKTQVVRAHRLDTQLTKLASIVLPVDQGWLQPDGAAPLKEGSVILGVQNSPVPRFFSLNPTGDIRWRVEFPQCMITGPLVLRAAQDGVLAATTLTSQGVALSAVGREDVWVLKLDFEGRLQWEVILGGEDDDALKALLVLPDGGAVVVGVGGSGELRSSGSEKIWRISVPSFFAARISASGDVSAVSEFHFPGNDVVLGFPQVSLASRLGILLSSRIPPLPGQSRLSFLGMDESLQQKWELQPGGQAVEGHAVYPAKDGGVLLVTQSLKSTLREGEDIVLTLTKYAGESQIRTESTILTAKPGRRPHGLWSFPTRRGLVYTIESSPSLLPNSWTPLLTIPGDNAPFAFPGRSNASAEREFFRVHIHAP